MRPDIQEVGYSGCQISRRPDIEEARYRGGQIWRRPDIDGMQEAEQ